MGYRHFDRVNTALSYPFGYGLSYTEFMYEDMQIVKSGYDYTVSVNVRNVGDTPGKEAVQLYVAAPGNDKPLKELRAFSKTGLLEPGQSQRITMTFTTYDLASFDEESGMWVTEKGIYRCLLGASSADIRLSDDFAVYSRISVPAHPMTRCQTPTL